MPELCDPGQVINLSVLNLLTSKIKRKRICIQYGHAGSFKWDYMHKELWAAPNPWQGLHKW